MTYAVLTPARVLEVLSVAPTLRSAVYQLGTSETRLRKLCKADPSLAKAFAETRARGRAKAARSHVAGRCLMSLGPITVP